MSIRRYHRIGKRYKKYNRDVEIKFEYFKYGGVLMRLQKRLIIFMGTLCLLSFILCLLLNYCFNNLRSSDFWLNISVSIFGSSLLAVFTAILAYFQDRRKTLEAFYIHTKSLLKYLNKYQSSGTLKEKLIFFIDYYELDKNEWDRDYRDICLFFDPFKKNINYIFNSIYQPILNFNYAVENHYWHFKWYLDGTGLNDKVMKTFIKELEDILLDVEIIKEPVKFDIAGNAIEYCEFISITPKFVLKLEEELSNKYYSIMYMKKLDTK